MAPLCTYPGLAILHQAIEISNVLINRLIQRQGGRRKQKLKPLVPPPSSFFSRFSQRSHKHAQECLRLPDDVAKALGWPMIIRKQILGIQVIFLILSFLKNAERKENKAMLNISTEGGD